jgi:hypothetical protein
VRFSPIRVLAGRCHARYYYLWGCALRCPSVSCFHSGLPSELMCIKSLVVV